MIFALGEDGTLDIFADIVAVQTHCEGIDVESSVWDFFGENGEPLTPIFRTPNVVTRSMFGLFSAIQSSQDFALAPAKDGEPWLKDCLAPNTILNPNGRFSSLAEVVAYLESRS